MRMAIHDQLGQPDAKIMDERSNGVHWQGRMRCKGQASTLRLPVQCHACLPCGESSPDTAESKETVSALAKAIGSRWRKMCWSVVTYAVRPRVKPGANLIASLWAAPPVRWW